jgi:hypothetical protein
MNEVDSQTTIDIYESILEGFSAIQNEHVGTQTGFEFATENHD